MLNQNLIQKMTLWPKMAQMGLWLFSFLGFFYIVTHSSTIVAAEGTPYGGAETAVPAARSLANRKILLKDAKEVVMACLVGDEKESRNSLVDQFAATVYPKLYIDDDGSRKVTPIKSVYFSASDVSTTIVAYEDKTLQLRTQRCTGASFLKDARSEGFDINICQINSKKFSVHYTDPNIPGSRVTAFLDQPLPVLQYDSLTKKFSSASDIGGQEDQSYLIGLRIKNEKQANELVKVWTIDQNNRKLTERPYTINTQQYVDCLKRELGAKSTDSTSK